LITFLSNQEAPALIAHNAYFDFGFLFAHAEKNNLPNLKNYIVGFFDTAYMLNNPFTRLEDALKTYEIEYKQNELHSALYDAEKTYKLFKKLQRFTIEDRRPLVIEDFQKLVRSPNALKDFVKENFKLSVPSVDNEFLSDFCRVSPFFTLVKEYRKVLNDLSKAKVYLQALETGEMYTTYTTTKVRTNRLSSTNPNLQNVIKDDKEKVESEIAKHVALYKLRSAIKPHPGFSFIFIDYSQLELRILSEVGNISLMKEIYKDPTRDLHTETALAAGLGASKEGRFKAKAVNFGLIYGRGLKSLQKTLKLETLEQAAEIKEKVLGAFKEFEP
jgi:DNA polymerase I-like protein with 3'-5' exonuclease and polymerase domains